MSDPPPFSRATRRLLLDMFTDTCDSKRWQALDLSVLDFARERSWPARSTANQALLPFVDQNVGDGGRTRRSQLAARCGIARRQFLEFFLSYRGSEQRPQFVLPFFK